MKKRIALFLCAVMVLGTTACAGSNAQTADANSADTEQNVSESGLSYADYEDSDIYVASTEAATYEGTDEWPEVVLNFDCSTGDASTWAQAGYYFNALMQESSGGKVSIAVYAGEQLTNGDQVAGIQALIDGNPIQVSLHSNLIYANFDPRFNVVSLPFAFEDYDEVDKVLGGEAGEALKDVLAEYGLVCEGIAENGFRQITNSKQPITSLEDLSSLKLRICSNDLCAEIYKEWGCDASVMNWSETYTALSREQLMDRKTLLQLLIQLQYRMFRTTSLCGMLIMIASSSALTRQHMISLLMNRRLLLMPMQLRQLNIRRLLIEKMLMLLLRNIKHPAKWQLLIMRISILIHLSRQVPELKTGLFSSLYHLRV